MGSVHAAGQIVELLWVHIVRVWMADGMTLPEGWLRLLREPFLPPAVRLIHAHARPRLPVTVSQLAQSCGLSRTVFIGRFGARAGVAPATYVFNWEMRLATSLREMTDTPVDQMGRQLGYSSSNSFNVAVKRWSTLTPGKMRNLASRRSAAEFQTAPS
jgi:AraC-like DNA-binding protein